MILPGYEPRSATIPAKVDYELSLEYQLEKVIWCVEKFSKRLRDDRHPNDLENETYFLFDTLINNVSTLAEYYFSNVVYSLIGTILDKPKKIEFRGLDNSNYIDKKKDIFKKFKIGELTKGTDVEKKEYLNRCNECFDRYLEFIISGRYDILHEINNHIKHNVRLRGFWLKPGSSKDDFIKYHFLRFTKDHEFLFKDKIIKSLLSIDYDEASQDNFELIFKNGKYNSVKKHGRFIFFANDDVVYVRGPSGAGLTSNSIVKKSYQLCLEIIKTLISSKTGYITELEKLNYFKEVIEREDNKLTLI
ncbi:hypothetical protein SOV92_06000 [Pectobacterium brasiliense]|uniref:Uncharacterized protein n=1 Tax=Pectobacterium brasiliense TaxID=180957 RepID=A0AAW9H116_9GAMM|nr:hypothetical protein [Pectobacterium brasiliense]MDY4377395.1 hypothetical protein [Pectobacterium brasiliense]